jgi:hypothetical protein
MSVDVGMCVYMSLTQVYLHMPRISGRLHSNLTALVASGKRGKNDFSLYTFCTF